MGCSNSTIDNKKDTKMDKQITNNYKIPPAGQVEILSADLIPFFSEAKISMLLVKIIDIKLVQDMDVDIEMEVGILTTEVLQVFHSKDFEKGAIIGIPFKRVFDPSIRARNNINQWNNLPLVKGRLLLVGGVTDIPNVLKAQAAINIDTLDAPVISAVRQCYIIEKDNDIMEKHLLLQGALTGRENILRYYTLDFLGRRSMLGRKVGAEIISKVIISEKTAYDDKLDLSFYLTRNYFFDSELGNDSTNQIVVASLAMILIQETEVERLSDAAQLLASCVLDEFSPKMDTDRLIRSSLISAIQNPTPRQVRKILQDLLYKVDEMERERIKKLLDVWQISE